MIDHAGVNEKISIFYMFDTVSSEKSFPIEKLCAFDIGVYLLGLGLEKKDERNKLSRYCFAYIVFL